MVSNKIGEKISKVSAAWRLAGHWSCDGEQILLYHLQNHWGWKKLLWSLSPAVTLELCYPTFSPSNHVSKCHTHMILEPFQRLQIHHSSGQPVLIIWLSNVRLSCGNYISIIIYKKYIWNSHYLNVSKIHKNWFFQWKTVHTKVISVSHISTWSLSWPTNSFGFPLLILSLIALGGRASIWVEALLPPHSQNLKKVLMKFCNLKKYITSFIKVFFNYKYSIFKDINLLLF